MRIANLKEEKEICLTTNDIVIGLSLDRATGSLGTTGPLGTAGPLGTTGSCTLWCRSVMRGSS